LKKVGSNYYIRTLTKTDINEEYLSWLTDPEVNQYLEVRFTEPTIDSVEVHIETYDNNSSFFCGVFTVENDLFIGTISLRTDVNHGCASYGYIIGNKNYWGTAAGIDSVSLMLDLAFDDLNLRKVWGGAYVANIGSLFNFKKLGFVKEGNFRRHLTLNGKPTDSLMFGIFKEEWYERRLSLNYTS
jgi:[ribosomal protein S5]-alanine N-acetyltransferase